MQLESKLAALSGSEMKSNVFEIVDLLKRALSAKSGRCTSRRLRDLDTWSDQAEVAYYEECHGRRA